MHHIIVDTNIMMKSYFLDSGEWKRLLKLNQCDNCQVEIPEFVFNECVKKYSDNIIQTVNKLVSVKDTVRRYRIPTVDLGMLDQYKIVDHYRKELKAILDDKGIIIIDYPVDTTIVQKIATRYFDMKKPFSPKRISFQDAIIWESILEHVDTMESDDELHFVTNNYKDFADETNNDALHHDLKKEVWGEDVYLYSSLEKFLEEKEELIKAECVENAETENEEKIDNIQSLTKKYLLAFCDFFENDEIATLILESGLIRDYVYGQLVDTIYETEYDFGWGDEPEEEEIIINENMTDVNLVTNSEDVNTYLQKFSLFDQFDEYPNATLLFVDPFDFGTVKIPTLTEFIRRYYCEVIFNFFTSDYIRNGIDVRIKECIGEAEINNKEDLIKYINKSLKVGKIKHVFSYRFKTRTNTELYQILFASPHHRGLEKLKEALWTVFQGKFEHRNEGIAMEQLSFFGEQEIKEQRERAYANETKALLIEYFKGKEVPYDEISSFILENTMMKATGISKWILKPLIQSKKITKCGNTKSLNNYSQDSYVFGKE